VPERCLCRPGPVGTIHVCALPCPLAAAGIPLDRLLASATIEAARAFHLERRYGTIEAGKVANLLLLRANPLETVAAYDAIDLVISRGQVLDRAALRAS